MAAVAVGWVRATTGHESPSTFNRDTVWGDYIGFQFIFRFYLGFNACLIVSWLTAYGLVFVEVVLEVRPICLQCEMKYLLWTFGIYLW